MNLWEILHLVSRRMLRNSLRALSCERLDWPVARHHWTRTRSSHIVTIIWVTRNSSSRQVSFLLRSIMNVGVRHSLLLRSLYLLLVNLCTSQLLSCSQSLPMLLSCLTNRVLLRISASSLREWSFLLLVFSCWSLETDWTSTNLTSFSLVISHWGFLTRSFERCNSFRFVLF